MGIIEDVRLQDAVYWARLGTDGYGRPTYATPIQLEGKVRWDDVQIEFTGAEGDREFSNARVMVGEDLALGGLIMLGVLADVVDWVEPTNNPGALEIRGKNTIPDIDNDEIYRDVML